MPHSHLRALGDWLSDPVSVAEKFLGPPYLWGGNSRAGIDCSGLVQTAFAACGLAVPGIRICNSRQGSRCRGRFNAAIWCRKGHVALVVDGDRLIHAKTGWMSVAYEGTAACIARIAAAEGPVTARRR